jgi:hypothetical protein
MRLAALALAAAYACFRVAQLWPGRAGVGAERYGDSAEYLRIARLPLTSARFYTEHKPWAYPLLLKLLGESQGAVVWAQLLLSVACWLVLAHTVARRIERRAGALVAAAAVLLVGCAWEVTQWDGAVLTESASISLLVLLVALLLRFAERPRGRTLVALGAVCLAFSGLRDTNGLLALLVVAPVAAVSLSRGRAQALTLVTLAVACLGLAYATASVRRWEILVADQVGKRALNDPRELRYFERHGMPVRPHLAYRIFRDTRSPLPAATFEGDPQLAYFLPWLRRDGRATYRGWLLSHPDVSIEQPLRRLPLLESARALDSYRAPGWSPLLPRSLASLAYPVGGRAALLALLLALGVAVVAANRGLRRRAWVVPLALALASIPLCVAVWDGEPSEIPRHALLAALSLRLGVVVFACLAAEPVVQALRARHGAVPHAAGQPDGP